MNFKMAKKYYAYYLIDGGKGGMDECSEIVKGVKVR